jgi:hypothetical protein
MRTPSTKRRKVSLQGQVRGGAGIEFLFAELPEEQPLPFAVVYYADEGKPQNLGLRFDLDKQVFLDHLEDKKQEKVLSRAASHIATYLGSDQHHSLPA